MTISPVPTPPEDAAGYDGPAASRRSYDWKSVRLGEWQRWQELTDPEVTDDQALRACTRIRIAAIDHGRRHGLHVESRRQRHGRILDLRFTAIEDPRLSCSDCYDAAHDEMTDSDTCDRHQ